MFDFELFICGRLQVYQPLVLNGLSSDFRRKVSDWETTGVFDSIAIKIDELLEKDG